MDIHGAARILAAALTLPAKGAPAAAPVPAKGAPPEPAPVAREQVEPPPNPAPTPSKVAEHLQDYLNSARRNLEFRVDADTRTTVITVRIANTGEVVRQIPNEQALRMLRHLNEGSATFMDLTA